MKTPICLIDNHYGIYQGQAFAEWLLANLPEQYENSAYKQDLDILLSGPGTDDYVEAMADVLDNIFVKIEQTTYWTWQNCDLWLVPEGYDDDTFFEC